MTLTSAELDGGKWTCGTCGGAMILADDRATERVYACPGCRRYLKLGLGTHSWWKIHDAT